MLYGLATGVSYVALEHVALKALRPIDCPNRWALVGAGAIGMLVLMAAGRYSYYCIEKLGLINYLKSKVLEVK